MSLFRRKKSLFSKFGHKNKQTVADIFSEDDLPLKLPPKQQLGRIYKIKKGHTASLIAAFALAIFTPLFATWLKDAQVDTRSSASPVRIPEVKYLVVVDATTNKDYALVDGPKAELVLEDMPERINIRAEVNERVASVVFLIDGQQISTEEKPPYALAGDNNGDYASWTPISGTATVTAIPYPLPNARGQAGQPYQIELSFRQAETITLPLPEQPLLLPISSRLHGDCNADGSVTIADYTALKIGLNQPDTQLPESCDANKDGQVTEEDNLCLQNLILGQSCEN